VQLQSAILIGISDPLRSSFKKMTLVEDDIGALWIGWGTVAIGVTPSNLPSRPGNSSNSSAGRRGQHYHAQRHGHVILHIQLPDGSVRQIRLHTEGHWTLGRNRKPWTPWPLRFPTGTPPPARRAAPRSN